MRRPGRCARADRAAGRTTGHRRIARPIPPRRRAPREAGRTATPHRSTWSGDRLRRLAPAGNPGRSPFPRTGGPRRRRVPGRRRALPRCRARAGASPMPSGLWSFRCAHQPHTAALVEGRFEAAEDARAAEAMLGARGPGAEGVRLPGYGNAKGPGDASFPALAIEAVVVEPVTTLRRKRAAAHHRLNGAQVGIELQPHQLTGVAVSIREPAFVERTGGQFAEAAIRIDPFDHFGLVEMAAQDQVRIIGQQLPGVDAVGELARGWGVTKLSHA